MNQVNQFSENQIKFFSQMQQLCFFMEPGLTYHQAFLKRIVAHFVLKTTTMVLFSDPLNWEKLKILNEQLSAIFSNQPCVHSDENRLWTKRLEPNDQNQVLQLYHKIYQNPQVLGWKQLEYLTFVNQLLIANQSQSYWKFNQALNGLVNNA